MTSSPPAHDRDDVRRRRWPAQRGGEIRSALAGERGPQQRPVALPALVAGPQVVGRLAGAAGERGALVGRERPVADDHPQEAEQDVPVPQWLTPTPAHAERLVLRHVDELARPLEAQALEPRRHVWRRFAGQDRPLADRIGLVGLRTVRQQPPAAVLDRDRPADLGLEVVDDLLKIGHVRTLGAWTSRWSGPGSVGSRRRSSWSGAGTARSCWRRRASAPGSRRGWRGSSGSRTGTCRCVRWRWRRGNGGTTGSARSGRSCSGTKGWWSLAVRSRPRRCARSAHRSRP